MKQERAIDEKLYPRLYKMNPRLYYIGWRVKELYLSSLFYSTKYLPDLRSPKDFATDEVIKEYKEIRRQIKCIEEEGAPQGYSSELGITNSAGLALYAMVRKYKPKVMLETGVANGHSTRIILSALNKNKSGKLISVEVSHNVGYLLKGIDKSRWTLVVGKPEKNLDRALKMVRSIDIFVHDSAHTYKNMIYEFRHAYPKLAQHSLVISDDVNWSDAFIDFCKEIKAKPLLFYSPRKVFGAMMINKQ